MARHLWREDIEQRAAICAEKDANPGTTLKELHVKFDVSTNIASAALEKTVDEWNALAKVTPLRAMVSEPPVAVQETPRVQEKVIAPPPAAVIAAPENASREAAGEWEYRAVIVRGRQSFNDIVYEQQGRDQGDWKPLAAKSFQDVLNALGRDRWELAGMAVLSHGAAGFTGMNELAFKRPRIEGKSL
nr:hypothetical protein [Candidatus Sigynarchaeota archaeon]